MDEPEPELDDGACPLPRLELLELLLELELLLALLPEVEDVLLCPVAYVEVCVELVPVASWVTAAEPEVAACVLVCVEPGSAKATAPAATTLANPTAVVAAFIRR